MSQSTDEIRADSESIRQPVGTPAAQLAAVWIRLCVFLAPVLLVVCVPVYLIDPYGLFAKRSIVIDSVRLENAARVNQLLQSIISFARNPRPNILLGDSQMAVFRADEIEAVAHRPYSNLSYGGGTLAESIATFWYAARTVRLQSVYFGMSFYSFTDNSRNRVSLAEHIVRTPLAYFSSGDVLEATWDDVAALFFHRVVNYQPTVDVATFWQQQLRELVRRKSSYSASENTLGDLRAIVRYCREHGIKVVFIIPPEHEDVRRGIRELGMNVRYADFKTAVSELGQSYDCDIANELTRDATNFQDPFHMTHVAATLMTKSIWSGKLDWCNRIEPANPRVQ
jgi:hypothetical protein